MSKIDDLIKREINEELRKPIAYIQKWVTKLQKEASKAQGYNVGEKQVALMNLSKIDVELQVAKLMLKEDVIPKIESSLHKIKDEAKREAIEKVAEEYGDFRISKENKKGRALRFYLLPHTKHKEGDDEES